jgi:hypothetical protein
MKYFENYWYKFFIKSNGSITICDRNNNVIINDMCYKASYGVILNSCEPPNVISNQLLVDKIDTIKTDDEIEIRSEIGRMNTPIVYKSRIKNIVGNKLYYSSNTINKIKQHIQFNKRQIIPLFYKISKEMLSTKGLYVKKNVINITELKDISIKYNHDNDYSLISLFGKSIVCNINIFFKCRSNSPVINIILDTEYNSDITVFNEQVEFTYVADMAEIFFKDKKVIEGDPNSHYWLDREGVKIGREENTFFLYHTPHVSSLKINMKRKSLQIVLDSMQDHRYRQVKQNISGNTPIYEERHASEYCIGDRRRNYFDVMFGYAPKHIPRIMNAPFGYQSVFVWTEHADRTSIRTQRAVYYGAENITDIKNANGGFTKYNIPVTKSVYYDNNSEMINSFNDFSVSIQTSNEFRKFLDNLYESGIYEICLHSVQPGSASRAKIEEAVKYMKYKYDTVTWIDHDARNSREDISSDGLVEKSPYYVKDIWEIYDTKYFWHYASEDGGYEGLDLLQSGISSNYRTPKIWKHPTVTGDFYSFATIPVTPRFLKGAWSDYINKTKLDKLISAWGVCILHTYPALTDRLFGISSGGWDYSRKNKLIKVSDNFNSCLQLLAEYRDRGDLYLCTVRDIMNYWISLDNIALEYHVNGTITITNKNNNDISGLSFAVRADKVYINNTIPKMKKIKEDIIFWFDIKGNDSVQLSFGK